MLRREKLWEFTLAITMSQQPENYGTLYPQSIVSVLLPTPTSGQPMEALT